MKESVPKFVEKVVKLARECKREDLEGPGDIWAKRVTLPMIPLSFAKHLAVPPVILGVLYGGKEPEPGSEASVFFRDYDDRCDDNDQKKIYYSGVTPDLYRDVYRGKVKGFLDRLLSRENVGKGLPGLFLEFYFDLFWDLHLGVSGDEVDDTARRVGENFHLLLGLLVAEDDNDVHRLERAVEFATANRDELDVWIRSRLDRPPKDTFAYYWIRNDMKEKDVVFEIFHNFLAFSQWGNTLHQTMERLRSDLDDESEYRGIRETFQRMMAKDNFDVPDEDAGGCPGEENGTYPFTPLDRFVMELFRTISPNAGSMSARPRANQSGREGEDQIIVTHRHKEISHDALHWSNPDDFDPDRYLGKRVSTQVDEKESERLGFPRCPFEMKGRPTTDDRETVVTNDAFGTVYNIHNDQSYPVLEHAGYAPFGFGYRRCPGELLTVEVIKDFLRKVHSEGIEFCKIRFGDNETALAMEKIPLGAGNMVRNDITFKRP